MAAWFKTRSWWHSSCGKDSFALSEVNYLLQGGIDLRVTAEL